MAAKSDALENFPRHFMRDFHLAAYYFPNYHLDPRNEAWHGKGWTEWNLLKLARSRFAGHRQPRVPLWGYLDEADPAVSRKQIEAASSHGIDSFIYDWYWFEDGPYLNRALEEGFMRAENNRKMSFGLMWANHDWTDIHPAKIRSTQTLHAKGAISPAAFERMTDHIAEKYFMHPSVWKIAGKPYFSFYMIENLIKGIGGLEPAVKALRRFEDKARAAGLPGIHFNTVIWQVPILAGEKAVQTPGDLMRVLGISSVTSYVWVHHVALEPFPQASYRAAMEKMAAQWPALASQYRIPYYPNVTMGWDSSPRACQSDTYENAGYPFCAVLEGNTPEAFQEALARARDYLSARPPEDRILTINAWNEWTESSYLEPDTEHGLGYLEAVRKVFKS